MGDLVEVTYTEAVAVSVDKPGKRWSDKAYDSLAGSLDEVDTDMHIGLPSGIAMEDIALHHGAELDMLMDELKRVDVTEHGAEPGPLIREAEHLSEEDAIDEIAVHVIVNLTFIVSEEFYMTRREPLVAFLKAYKRGTQCMLDHPDEASQLDKVERTSRELRLTKNTLEVQRLFTNELVQAL